MGTPTNVSTALPKWTTLEDLEKVNIGPVWVLNNSQSSGEPGRVLLSIPKASGNGQDLVRVPKSFIPFDITRQVPRAQLLASSEFRGAVSRKHLRLLSPAYAQAILNTDDGKEEQRRIDNLMSQAQAAERAMGVVEEDDTFDPNAMAEVDKAASEHFEAVQSKSAATSAKTAAVGVTTIAGNAVNESWTDTALKNALRNYGLERLTSADYKFLADRFKQRNKIMAFLREAHAAATSGKSTG